MKSFIICVEFSVMNCNFCVKLGTILFIVDDFRCSMLFRLLDRWTDICINFLVKCIKGYVMLFV